MAKKKVFVSFDYDRDKNYKLLLQAWDKNPSFEFTFNDQSVTVPINSTRASRIKAGISRKMAKATRCLVIVGKYTYRSDWVAWEIEKAKELSLKLVAVKTDRSNTSPAGLLNAGASWAMSFSQEAILRALG